MKLLNGYKKFMSEYLESSLDDWEQFWENCEIKEYKKGDIILNIDDVCDQLMYLTYGVARSYYLSEDGKDYTNNIFFNDKYSNTTNLFVVDFSSFLNQIPSLSSIEVLEDCQVISISYKKLQLLYDSIDNLEKFSRFIVEDAFFYQNQYIMYMQTKSAQERFNAFMKKSYHLLDKVPQYYIATLLGITPEHLSRLKSYIPKSKRWI